jgi:small redox-active disulfide protein 2
VKKIQVFGSGCTKCQTTAKLIEAAAKELAVAIELEKVEDYAKIAAAGVMATPGVAVDGKVVHSGGIPAKDRITAWLKG